MRKGEWDEFGGWPEDEDEEVFGPIVWLAVSIAGTIVGVVLWVVLS